MMFDINVLYKMSNIIDDRLVLEMVKVLSKPGKLENYFLIMKLWEQVLIDAVIRIHMISMF